MNASVNQLIRGDPEQVIISKFGLTICRSDMLSLLNTYWLNDNLLNFYLHLIMARAELKTRLPSVYAMDTFFVPRLLQGYSNVKRWTRRIDIFKKDIIAVPVLVDNVHWSMAIIDMRKNTISYYDSLGQPNPIVLNALKTFLQQESLDKRQMPLKAEDFKIEIARNVPKQTNNFDCGVFSCMFAEYITRNMPLTFSQRDIKSFRKQMMQEIANGRLRH